MSDTASRGHQLQDHHQGLKEKEVVEKAENGGDAPANGNATEEKGEQEADHEVDEEEEGGEEEEEEGDCEEEDGMKMRRLRQLQANGQLKMMRMTMLTPRSRRPMRMTRQQKKETLKASVTYSPSTSCLRI
ncbi:hypothetical protein D623_10023952 [Myotis brandtii]|uniref:Prothymosin alpha n=1 Tax=Myotis brandtii TaxID=109478 RepID=S7NB39_MYOBR|nr:hypothetical protein D623_10023952 [Myotis brandtii]